MHIEAAQAILESVRRRERQGDCPTEPAQSVETLENCLLTVAQQLTEAQADAELVDWIESVYVDGDELFIDRCELEPDGGGPLFIGFTIHRGKKDDGGNFVSGAETLRAALTAARLASSSETPNG